MSDCVFCDIVAGTEPATVVATRPLTLTIVPLHPVNPGHLVVLPKRHVESAAGHPLTLGYTMQEAVHLAKALEIDEFNLITSAGANATQTVPHLHVHLIPRWEDDGMTLPWGKIAKDHKPKPRYGVVPMVEGV